MRIYNLMKSLCFFAFSFFKTRHYDIVFYYPIHFNRGENGENKFFEPFYEICKKNDISYLVIEEPELFKKSRRNDDAVPFDLILIIILILRKIVPLKFFDSFQHREWFIARLLKPIFFRRFQFGNYIVLSNSMMGFFRGLNKEAQLYDYQHGVITSQHRGYITEDGSPAEHIAVNHANIMVYGEGFSEVLKYAVKDSYYDTHCYVLGHGIQRNLRNNYGKKTILFSLQFADPNPEFNQKILDQVLNFFQYYDDFFRRNGITVLLKHHPRFQHDIDPSPLYAFSFTKLYEGSLFDALESSCLHITFHSTATFEAASVGVPTLLFKNTTLDPAFFVKDYAYPLGIKSEKDIIAQIETYLSHPEQYVEDVKKVYAWHHRFYQPIDESLFVSLIKGKK